MTSDIDSKVSSGPLRLNRLKGVVEQLGTYLISETEVKNFQMTKDQITTLTAGIVSAEVIDEKWDGRSYYLKAMITADPKEVAKSVDALRTDVQKKKELEESKKKAEEAMKEVEKLKKGLALVKGDTNKTQRKYTSAIKYLSATDWFDRGFAFQDLNKFEDAIDSYNHAIKLNPTPEAYNNRGNAYGNLRNYQQAISDFNKALN
jgi:tetratricopeptide (TPR) repeat protein